MPVTTATEERARERADKFFPAPVINNFALTNRERAKFNARLRVNGSLLIRQRIRIENKGADVLGEYMIGQVKKLVRAMRGTGGWTAISADAYKLYKSLKKKGRSDAAVSREVRAYGQNSDALDSFINQRLERAVTRMREPLFAGFQERLRQMAILQAEVGRNFMLRSIALLGKDNLLQPELLRKADAFDEEVQTLSDLLFGNPPTELLESINERTNQIVSVALSEAEFQDLKDIIRRELYENVDGWGASGGRELARQIGKRFGDLILANPDIAASLQSMQNRLILWARTEGAIAQNDALIKTGREAGMNGQVWQTVGDSRVRPAHILNESDGVIGIDETFSDGSTNGGSGSVSPFMCLHPSQEVFGKYIAASRVKYSGRLIEVETREGNRLLCTPHHPVLTSKGFKFAGVLCKSDQLVCGPSQVTTGELSSIVARKENICNEKITVEQVFKSFVERGDLCCRDVSSLDFYGDGELCEEKIDVIWPDRCLRGQGDTPSFEHTLQCMFPKSTHSIVSTSHLPLDPIRVFTHEPPFDSFLFGCCSQGNVLFNQPTIHDIAITSNMVGYCVDTPLLIDVEVNDAVGVDGSVPHSWTYGDPTFAEYAVNDSFVAAEFLRQLRTRYALFIRVDDVVRINVHEHYSGFVYDVESLTGVMITKGGIISKQCRCVVGPALLPSKKRGTGGNPSLF